MTGTIIPPRSEEDGTASGARTDALTADLVAARIEALLKVLHRRRTELAAQIANLQSVQPSADTRLTVLTAELAGRMSSSVADLNLLIDQAEMFVRERGPERIPQAACEGAASAGPSPSMSATRSNTTTNASPRRPMPAM
jgi:chromosome condensin MukBEF ATPase and DNA-binding subunit MukB